MITRLSKQGGRRYGQMGGGTVISYLASVGSAAGGAVIRFNRWLGYRSGARSFRGD
jgi:hypothetical protein